MQLTAREKRLLIGVAVILLISTVYMFFYQPTISVVVDIETQIAAGQQELIGLRALAEANETIKEDIEALELQTQGYMEQLPEASDEPGLVKHFHRLFVVYDGLNALTIDDPISQGDYSSVEVNLQYNLNYDEYHALLLALEQSPYINDINSFSIDRVIADVEIPLGEEMHEQEAETEPAAEPEVVAAVTDEVSVSMSLTFYFSN